MRIATFSGVLPVLVVVIACLTYVLDLACFDQILATTALNFVEGLQSKTSYSSHLKDLNNEPMSTEGHPSGLPQVSANTETTRISLDGIPALMHRPLRVAKRNNLPCLIYIHGGGWTNGSAEEYSEFTSYLSNRSSAVVVSIDYRLAPDFYFPIPFEDCLKATEFLLFEGSKFGIDVSRISIAGDDAGGNLALAVALHISNNEAISRKITHVGIFYAPLQAFDFNLPSYRKFELVPGSVGKMDVVKNFLLYMFGDTSETLERLFSSNRHALYEHAAGQFAEKFNIAMLPFSFREISTPDGNDNIDNIDRDYLARYTAVALDTRVSPMLADTEDLKNLPSTYFIAPEIDPLRDESFMFYAILRELNMHRTRHVYYRSERHGFLLQDKENAVAKRAVLDYIQHMTTTWQ